MPFQQLGEALRPVFEGPAQGIGRGGETPLVERHQKADGAGLCLFAACGCRGALAADEPGDLGVEIELVALDAKIDAVRDALREDLARDPFAVGPSLGEVDHRLLGAAQIEGRAPVFHRLPD